MVGLVLMGFLMVHPRIRGERRSRPASASLTAGSSPHTRGTRWKFPAASAEKRFIPAYAGNAQMPSGWRVVDAVHPRIRGERSPRSTVTRAATGSSPHTRGTPCDHDGSIAAGRFIPAYAGNARSSSRCPMPAPVHPRIRGERTEIYLPNPKADGSSPHTRGTR